MTTNRNHLERAIEGDRAIRIRSIRARLQMMQAGAVTCAQCRRRPATCLVDGDRGLCPTCFGDRQVARQIERQKVEYRRLHGGR
jgi:hypothetical protein